MMIFLSMTREAMWLSFKTWLHCKGNAQVFKTGENRLSHSILAHRLAVKYTVF